MSSRFPLCETLLAGVAGLSVVVLLLLPQTPYLTPVLRPWALALSSVWGLWRLRALQQRLVRWQAWRVSATWVTTPDALVDPRGFTLGQGFPWTAREVEGPCARNCWIASRPFEASATKVKSGSLLMSTAMPCLTRT